jgi:hypothetical protein
MEELQRWLDMAATLRGCIIERLPPNAWQVDVWTLRPDGIHEFHGTGTGDSLTFAVVSAILDFRKNQED